MLNFNDAISQHRAGRLAEAEAVYRQILVESPTHRDAMHLLGVVLQQQGQADAAVEWIEAAIAGGLDSPAVHSHLGIALAQSQRHAGALSSFGKALAINPNYFEALYNRAAALRQLKRPAEALADFDMALAVKSDSVEGLLGRARTRDDLGQHVEAISDFDRLLKMRPGLVDAWVGKGNALARLRRLTQALEQQDQALLRDPRHPAAWVGRGNALSQLGQPADALAAYDRALELAPDLPEALNNKGAALRDLKRYAEAAETFARLRVVHPGFDYADSNELHSRLYSCDWSNYDAAVERITAQVMSGKKSDVPFSFLAICDDPRAQLECAVRYVADKYPPRELPPRLSRTLSKKIRIAYLSADFRGHAVSYLLAGVLEKHDRDAFDLTAIAFGPDSNDAMRQRLMPCFDRFIDVRQQSDREVAILMRELDVDIAVDLMGFTTSNRVGILAHRPAPVQLGFLGYPGTLGAPYLDYLIADARLVPGETRDAYAEHVILMPNCYQPNDAAREISQHTPTRAELGLPDDGFVFCCFNNNYKISPSTFAGWMRILGQVSGSVLWLLHDNDDSRDKLRHAAMVHGVSAERLVFADRVALPDHLARHRRADLFLDTLPYNAHTTASDALWAGLPVLTLRGKSFAGRVAASLLHAVGITGLIVDSQDAYERLAVRLAATPAELAALREQLDSARAFAALFDTDRYRRDLEKAYKQVWSMHQTGQPPQAFAVDSDRP